MAVPSWVYDDNLTDEQKLELFKKDMHWNLIAISSAIPLFIILLIIAKVNNWQ